MWIRLVSGSVMSISSSALLNGAVEAHRAGDAELAGVGAGAADHVGDLVGAGVAEAQLGQPLPDLVDRLVAHPAQHEVLLDRGARVAARVVAHDLAEAAHLLGGQVAAGDLDLHGREPVLALRVARWTRGSARTRCRRRWAARTSRRPRGRWPPRRAGAAAEVGSKSRSATQSPLSSSSTWVAELVDADLVDQHLDAGAGAVDAQPVLAVEDPEHGLGDLQVVAVVELHELVQRGGDARHDRRAAAHAHLHARARRRARAG